MKRNNPLRYAIALLFAALFILSCLAPAVFADEPVDTENGAYYGETAISAQAYSTYTISIPAELAENNSGEIAVSNMNLDEDYHIAVYITNLNENGKIPLYSKYYEENNLSCAALIYKDGMPFDDDGSGLFCEFFYGEDVAAEGRATHFITYTRDENSIHGAGQYSGVICFRVDCIPND